MEIEQPSLGIWRWCGALAVLAVFAGVAAAEPARIANPALKGLPADLKLVPADAAGFVTVRMADLWTSESTKKLREVLLKQTASFPDDFAREMGVPIDHIERVTIVIPATLSGQPTYILASIEPYKKEAILKAVTSQVGLTVKKGENGEAVAVPGPKLEEKKLDGKTYHEVVLPGEKKEGMGQAVYFASDRIYVRGDGKSIRHLIAAASETTSKGPLGKALASVGTGDFIVAHVTGAPLTMMAKQEPFKEMEPVQALAKLKRGDLTLRSNARETHITLDLSFQNEEQAKEAETAGKSLLGMVKPFVAQGRQGIAKELKNEGQDEAKKWFLQEADKMLVKLGEAVGHAKIEAQGTDMHASMQAPIPAGHLVTLFMPRAVASSAPPPDPKGSNPSK